MHGRFVPEPDNMHRRFCSFAREVVGRVLNTETTFLVQKPQLNVQTVYIDARLESDQDIPTVALVKTRDIDGCARDILLEIHWARGAAWPTLVRDTHAHVRPARKRDRNRRTRPIDGRRVLAHVRAEGR